MSSSNAVRWTEGMFLRPQHFQQSDLFNSAQLRYVAGTLHPFPWGVRRVEIDIDALENEIVRVNRLELVFADGLTVRYPEAAQLAEHSFKDAFAATMDSLGVFACVRSLEDRRAGLERYSAHAEQRHDIYAPDNEASVEFVVPRAALVFTNNPEDDRLSGLESLKIAEVRRTGRAAPRYELSRQYIPPLLRCDASPVLIGAVRQVHDQVCAASRSLGQHRRDRGAEGLAYGVGDLEHLLILQMLNQFVPTLQHALAHGGGHPFELYTLLAQLRGALTTYSTVEEPFTFPEYEHTNLAGSLFPLIESIRRLLEHLLPTHYEELTLVREGFQFSASLDESLLREGGPFLLALRGPGTTEALRSRVEGQAKITSVADMRQLVRFADRGVPTRFVEHPPAEIPRYADHSYFVVETGDPRWKRIREAGDFCFYLADAEPDLAVRLFVVLARGRKQ
jgi:type VI secretion system protein ImpJ